MKTNEFQLKYPSDCPTSGQLRQHSTVQYAREMSHSPVNCPFTFKGKPFRGLRRFKSSRRHVIKNADVDRSGKLSIEGFSPVLTAILELEARKQGFEVVDDHSQAISLSLDPKEGFANNGSRIAVISEPKVVLPEIYSERVLRSFKSTIAVSVERAAEIKTTYCVEIQPIPTAQGMWPKNRRNKTCAVFGNKFSANKKSNYGLRRKSLILDEMEGNKIDVYGVDWLDPLWLQAKRRIYSIRKQIHSLGELSMKEALGDFCFVPKNYRGIMGFQMEQLFEYETSLVIENQSDYTSEKLWNSLVAGAVPIYVGSSLLRNDLKELVIEVESSPEAIIEKVNNVSIKEIHEKREKTRDFLREYDFHAHLRHSAARLIEITRKVIGCNV